MSESKLLVLKPGRERSVQHGHPWIFSGAVARTEGSPESGETVAITNANKGFLAWAAYSPTSQIVARIWTMDPNVEVGEAYLRQQMARAIARRGDLLATQAVRLVFAEADLLPGFILDRYGDTLVAQYLTAGAEYWRAELARLALELGGGQRVYERSDAEVRKLEGLAERNGLQIGPGLAEALVIEENGIKFRIDIKSGHKTGFYLDQRTNRSVVRSLAKGREALDCFCYTGGFALNLLAGGANTVVGIDSSSAAIKIARENSIMNGFSEQQVSWHEADVFQALRTFRDQGRQFDLIVLDPPKFAPTVAFAKKAARGYKDINLMAMKLLRDHGILVTFSCSGGIDELFFQKILAGAALDAGVHAQIVQRLHQERDHPVALNYPESAYLKGFVLSIDKSQG